MNDEIREEIREIFREAALKGTPQIIGRLWDYGGGYCAVGLLQQHSGAHSRYHTVLDASVEACHLCGATTQTFHQGEAITNVWDLLVHLNNDHRLDWLGLAEKLP